MDGSRALEGIEATVTAAPVLAERELSSVPPPSGAGPVSGILADTHAPAFGPSAYDRLRRIVDVIAATTALLILAPLITAIAAAISLDSPGSPIYVQWRTGLGGRRFRMFKFRTMVRDADAQRTSLHHRNLLTSPDFKVADDPRITRVGRLLRRWSFDEVPQLVNIVIGDMTLIGPRPTSFPSDDYEPWQLRRLAVKPGLTGLWQISGRSNIDFADRVRLDIEYIEKRSLRLDLSILLKTPLAVLRGDGAH